MSYTDPRNQFQYQHRGYAKFVDIARLFGGSRVVADFWYRENMYYVGELGWPCPELSETDHRTFHRSLNVGLDLTPLICKCICTALHQSIFEDNSPHFNPFLYYESPIPAQTFGTFIRRMNRR
jgi:hypothetical protein